MQVTGFLAKSEIREAERGSLGIAVCVQVGQEERDTEGPGNWWEAGS